MLRRWLLVLVLLLTGGMAIAGQQALLMMPPTTIEDAVAVSLRRQGAPTTHIQIADAHCVPSRDTCLSYIADVVIADERNPGRLACAKPWRACTLTMAEFGLRAAAVPDVSDQHPWITTAEAIIQSTITWVQRQFPRS